MSGWASLGKNISGINPFKAGDKDQAKAQGSLTTARGDYENLDTPDLSPVTQERAAQQQAAFQGVGPSAFDSIQTDPANMQAQRAQLAALSSLAANGGHNAQSDANLAAIQQRENANAAGQRGAIQQSFAARGMGGSGAEMLAQLSASQNAVNNQSAEDLAVRGQDQTNALNAGMGAANLASGLESQQYGEAANRAAAADAINRFNAQGANANSQFNAQGANQLAQFNAGQGNAINQYNANQAETEYQNRLERAKGLAGVDMGGVNYFGSQAAAANAAAGNLAGSLIGAGAKYAAASRGGQVPGHANVAGDSYHNDNVPIIASPHEVVVPRSLALHGTKDEIGTFVQHPPQVKSVATLGDKNKEAMLSALKNIRNRR